MSFPIDEGAQPWAQNSARFGHSSTNAGYSGANRGLHRPKRSIGAKRRCVIVLSFLLCCLVHLLQRHLLLEWTLLRAIVSWVVAFVHGVQNWFWLLLDRKVYVSSIPEAIDVRGVDGVRDHWIIVALDLSGVTRETHPLRRTLSEPSWSLKLILHVFHMFSSTSSQRHLSHPALFLNFTENLVFNAEE